MKHFWKVTAKLFRNLIVAKVFGFVLSATILLAVSNVIGSVITQICSVLLIVVLMFTTSWEQGSKDANMIEIGRLKTDRNLGLKAGLVASLFELIAAVCLLLTKAGIVGEAYTRFFGIYNSNFVPIHQALLPNTLTVAEHGWGGYIVAALTVLIAPLCATFGYRLGLHQISISDTLLYTTPEARERHETRLKERHMKRGKRKFFR